MFAKAADASAGRLGDWVIEKDGTKISTSTVVADRVEFSLILREKK